MEEKIKSFFACNGLFVNIENKVEGLQVTTYYISIAEYNTNIINKVLKMDKTLSLYLQINNINIKLDNETGFVILEIPKKHTTTLLYNELVKDYRPQKSGLYVNIGMTTDNKIKNINLCNTPHLLIAGTTGSGKSVLINSIILQLLENYRPEELELILIDIKQVEFSIYENIPHLLYKPITKFENARKILENTMQDMSKRYNILKENQCRNIVEYNNKNDIKMKYKLMVIDELAELLMLEQNKLKSNLEGYDTIEQYICRIAQLGRACGIHLIVSTQRPSGDVVSGLIKSNIPSRIALSVSSSINSRVIIDQKGAENLNGKGDMLLKLIGIKDLERLQGAYIDITELEQRLTNIINQYNYNNTITDIAKRNVLKELEQLIYDCYSKSNLKSQTQRNLKKNEYIQKIINELGTAEEEKEQIKQNYFKILNNITKYFEGYTQEEKEQTKAQIKEEKEKQKIKRRDKILNLYLWNRILKGINKKL